MTMPMLMLVPIPISTSTTPSRLEPEAFSPHEHDPPMTVHVGTTFLEIIHLPEKPEPELKLQPQPSKAAASRAETGVDANAPLFGSAVKKGVCGFGIREWRSQSVSELKDCVVSTRRGEERIYIPFCTVHERDGEGGTRQGVCWKLERDEDASECTGQSDCNFFYLLRDKTN
ncbi:hypothetical protein VTN77DRAFT_7017 [Rasamsonia byssochlamydoides]|uniref:uncharacterized protein n=1 Tax=Rasamsonia byssochlamydoides TaxID=89139 RepID=UPI003742877B